MRGDDLEKLHLARGGIQLNDRRLRRVGVGREVAVFHALLFRALDREVVDLHLLPRLQLRGVQLDCASRAVLRGDCRLLLRAGTELARRDWRDASHFDFVFAVVGLLAGRTRGG